MTILAIDTSTTRGSVAVLEDGVFLLNEQFSADRSHSSSLFVVLERALAVAPKLDRIVIGLGPGSFAGVRIAIAAAMGIALTRGAELAGIPSVATLETGCDDYVAIGDARRETFYWTEVRRGICTEGPELLSDPQLRERLAATPLPVFTSDPAPPAVNVTIALPSAAIAARLAAESRGITATGDLEPIYLREPHITRPKQSASLLPPRGGGVSP